MTYGDVLLRVTKAVNRHHDKGDLEEESFIGSLLRVSEG